jgi:hypothetical protein
MKKKEVIILPNAGVTTKNPLIKRLIVHIHIK